MCRSPSDRAVKKMTKTMTVSIVHTARAKRGSSWAAMTATTATNRHQHQMMNRVFGPFLRAWLASP